MTLSRLKFLNHLLISIDCNFLEVRPENSSEFSEIKSIMGRGMHTLLF